MHVYSSRNKSWGMFQFFPPYWSLRAINGWLRKRKKGLKSSDLCHYADTASKIKGETVTYKTAVSSFWKHSIGCNRFFPSPSQYLLQNTKLEKLIWEIVSLLLLKTLHFLSFDWGDSAMRNLAIWVLEFGKANKTHSSWLAELHSLTHRMRIHALSHHTQLKLLLHTYWQPFLTLLHTKVHGLKK